MSIPLFAEHGMRGSRRERIRARAIVGVARVLTLMPPLTIRRVLAIARRGAAPATAAHALDARRLVCGVSERCAGLGCLQRSIAVHLLCRLDGVAPAWCTGFGSEPFVAHAWVEVDGVPIEEPAEVAGYRVVLQLAQPSGRAA